MPGTMPTAEQFVHDGARVHTVAVRANVRITADGWEQDVRHLELETEEDVEYLHTPARV